MQHCPSHEWLQSGRTCGSVRGSSAWPTATDHPAAALPSAAVPVTPSHSWPPSHHAPALPCTCAPLQAAKTYLERHYETFASASVDELVRHGLKALANTLQDAELSSKNCSVAIVGKGLSFTLLEDDAVAPYVDALKEEEGAAAPEAVMEEAAAPAADAPDEAAAGAGDAAAGEGEGGDAPAPMET